MSAAQRLWGYKPDGSARLFLVIAGGVLPAGWSSDIGVIEDPEKRTGEAVSAAAGPSVYTPVVASEEAAQAVKDDAKQTADELANSLRYDEDNQLIPPPKKRIGR